MIVIIPNIYQQVSSHTTLKKELEAKCQKYRFYVCREKHLPTHDSKSLINASKNCLSENEATVANTPKAHSVKQETNDWSMKYLKLAQFNEFLPQISFNARYSKAMGN